MSTGIPQTDCAIYFDISTLVGSSVFATICIVLVQLVQQLCLSPVFIMYYGETYPQRILFWKGLWKDYVAWRNGRASMAAASAGTATTAAGAGTNATGRATSNDIEKGKTTTTTATGTSANAVSGTTQMPLLRLASDEWGRWKLEDLEERIVSFKITLSSSFSIDFTVYVIIAAMIYFTTSMITVSLILYDTKTVHAYWSGGFDETLSAYNVFLAIVTIIGYSTMYMFINILNQVFSAPHLNEKLGYSLKSSSKITADTLFWICVGFMGVALIIKWPYIPIILYILSVFLLIILAFMVVHLVFKLILLVLGTPINWICRHVRSVMPSLFISDTSNMPHSPTYFIVAILYGIMNKVTLMDDEVKMMGIRGTTLGLNGFFALWVIVIIIFSLTVKSDPSTVYVCVGTETIVLTISFMSSAAAILARPIILFLYGDGLLNTFAAFDASMRPNGDNPPTSPARRGSFPDVGIVLEPLDPQTETDDNKAPPRPMPAALRSGGAASTGGGSAGSIAPPLPPLPASPRGNTSANNDTTSSSASAAETRAAEPVKPPKTFKPKPLVARASGGDDAKAATADAGDVSTAEAKYSNATSSAPASPSKTVARSNSGGISSPTAATTHTSLPPRSPGAKDGDNVEEFADDDMVHSDDDGRKN